MQPKPAQMWLTKTTANRLQMDIRWYAPFLFSTFWSFHQGCPFKLQLRICWGALAIHSHNYTFLWSPSQHYMLIKSICLQFLDLNNNNSRLNENSKRLSISNFSQLHWYITIITTKHWAMPLNDIKNVWLPPSLLIGLSQSSIFKICTFGKQKDHI